MKVRVCCPPCEFAHVFYFPGPVGTGGPGEDAGGAEDGRHDPAGAPRRRRAGRSGRPGERRAAQRRRRQAPQRRGARHRGAEERARQETAAGRADNDTLC